MGGRIELVRTVLVESPLEHETYREPANLAYLDLCLRDCLMRNESPHASHKLLLGALNDRDDGERELGMRAGWMIGMKLDTWVFYLDRGFSDGMRDGLKFVLGLREDLPTKRRRVEFRAFGSHQGLGVDVDFSGHARSHRIMSTTVPYRTAIGAFPRIATIFSLIAPELI